MKAIAIVRTGPPASLTLVERPTPEPRPGEVLIRVAAAGVNFADCLARQGFYPEAPKRPFVPGYEVAGEVAAVGADVTGWTKGQRVVAFTEFGGYAEYAIARSEMMRELPSDRAFTEAAGLPVIFVTAYLALFGSGVLYAGARVLIHAAAGGLGQAAVQLALRAGADVFGTAGSEEKVALLRRLGVQHPINYRTADFARAVIETSGERALDLIVDSVGGSFIRREVKLLAPGGRLVLLGVGEMSGRSRLAALGVVLKFPRLSTLKLLAQSRAVVGLNVLQVFRGNAALARHAFDEVMKLYIAGAIKPPVSTVLPLADAHRAHELLESRQSTGKIVLTVDGH